MSSMSVVLTLRALDKATAPLRSVQAALKDVTAAAKAATGGISSKINASLKEAQAIAKATAQSAKASMLEGGLKAAATAAPVMAAVKSYHEFEDVLNDIGTKGDVAGAKLQVLGDNLRAMAPRVNQTSVELAKGMDVLAGFGMKMPDAAKIIEPMARTATATKATMEDLSRSSFAAFDNLKTDLKDIPRMFDVMTQAGKEGAFELKDMAQYFPKLTAGAYQLGFKGVEGIASLSAALQVARKGSGDAAEAANNMANFFQKVNAKDARKNFKDIGVDIMKVTGQAKKSADPMKVYMDAIGKAVNLKKDGTFDLTKLTDVFGDAQVQNFLKPMLQAMAEYERIRESSINAKGTVDQDFSKRMSLGVEKTKAMQVAMHELSVTIGQIFAPLAGAGLDAITGLINKFNTFAMVNPEITAGIIMLVGVLSSLTLVSVAGKLAFSFLATGAIGFARALMLLSSPIFMVIRLVAMLGAAMLANPIGLAIAAIAVAALLIYKYWTPISAFFAKLWDGIKNYTIAVWQGITGVIGAYVQGVITIVTGIGSAIKAALSGDFAGALNILKTSFSDAFNSVKTAALDAFNNISAALGQVFAPIADLAKGAWDAIKATFSGFSWSDLLPTFDWQSIIPPMPAFLKKMFGGGASDALTSAKVVDQVGTASEAGALPKELQASTKAIAAKNAELQKLTKTQEALKKATPKNIEPQKMPEPPKFDVGAMGLDAATGKANEVMASVNAIPPAATQASSGATATLAALDGTTHGVRFMETFAAGIKAAQGSVTAAVSAVVGAARAYLPHSPAKVGPLSDLDKVKFSETLATAIKPAPAIAAVAAVAAGMQAAIPSAFASPAFHPPQAYAAPQQNAGGNTGGAGNSAQNNNSAGNASGNNTTINVTLNVQGGGEGAASIDFKKHGHEIAKIVSEQMAKQNRLKF